jgi:hypothetical protein
MTRIYLDTCCLNRPFDDQTQDRIRLESEAILLILRRVGRGELEMVGSDVSALEIAANRDPERRRRVQVLARAATLRVVTSDYILQRGDALEEIGFGAYDGLHLACAEAADADILLTTDDRFVKRAKRLQDRLTVRVSNPLTWVQELPDQ